MTGSRAVIRSTIALDKGFVTDGPAGPSLASLPHFLTSKGGTLNCCGAQPRRTPPPPHNLRRLGTMPDSPATTQAGISPATPPTQTGNDGGRGPNLADGGGSHSRKLGVALFLLLLVVGIALLIAFFAGVRHWLALHTGTLHGGPDLYYNFWSGFGSDLGEATLISAV